MGDNTKTFTNDNFDNEVLQSDKPVLVDFWATWCGPCQAVGPVIDQVADAFAGKAVVGKVNVDDQSEVAGRYGIASIPTVLVFQNGEIVDRFVGVRGREDYESALNKASSN